MTQDVIVARPTKKLFIETLTQDVNVRACILDLIDNSIDSYIRYAIKDRRRVELDVLDNSFRLYDTCGGIDKDFLKQNVFVFGNPNPKFDNPTLGMYGIGLKRSIFKLGKSIQITTDDGKNYSRINLNVIEWEANNEDWSIPFETDVSQLNGEQPYTEIVITNLNEDVREKLSLVSFKNDLLETLRRVYCIIIKDNLDFFFNTKPVPAYPLLVPSNDENYSPQIHVETYDEIQIQIVCFLDPSKGKRLKDAVNQIGWNLFCNKRLILSNDISEMTGWRGGEQVKDKSMLPKYHSIYNEFRGIVFLSSNNPFKLPLNTSKTSLNIEDKNYNYILNRMVNTARPIIDFLSGKYAEEKKKEDQIELDLQETSDEDFNMVLKDISDIEIKPSNFRAPQRKNAPQKTTVRISYEREKGIADKVLQYLRVKTYKDVGEKTFEYFLTMEGLNDE